MIHLERYDTVKIGLFHCKYKYRIGDEPNVPSHKPGDEFPNQDIMYYWQTPYTDGRECNLRPLTG